MKEEETPNGSDLGLLPHGGIAALSSSKRGSRQEYVAYCFLPLPAPTSLPVHVNGHFALDGSRRDLWKDDSDKCQKTKWNVFMKVRVLAPAYATLIDKARKKIPHCEKDSGKIYFSDEGDATKALSWYHSLFPDPAKDPDWDLLAQAVYQSLKETPVLPVVCESNAIVTKEKDQPGEPGSNTVPGNRSLRKRKGRIPSGDTKGTDSCRRSYRNASYKFSHRKLKHPHSARESQQQYMKAARQKLHYSEKRTTAKQNLCS